MQADEGHFRKHFLMRIIIASRAGRALQAGLTACWSMLHRKMAGSSSSVGERWAREVWMSRYAFVVLLGGIISFFPQEPVPSAGKEREG